MVNGESPAKLRFDFIGLLFALAIGQVGTEVGEFFSRGNSVCEYPFFFTHLILVVYIIASSWVGWQSSTSKGNKENLDSAFNMSFFILLVDLVIVICYYILVKDADGTSPSPESKKECLLIIYIFGLYVVWDILTKLFPQDNPTNYDIKFKHKDFFKRVWPTVLCFGISFLIFLHMTNKIEKKAIVVTDFALIFTFILFRALKSYLTFFCDEGKDDKNEEKKVIRKPSKTYMALWISFSSLVIIFCFVLNNFI